MLKASSSDELLFFLKRKKLFLIQGELLVDAAPLHLQSEAAKFILLPFKTLPPNSTTD